MKSHRRHFTKLIVTAAFYLLAVFPVIASAAEVVLQWDANQTAPDGYRIYQRVAGQSYNYAEPKWAGTATTCTLNDLSDGTTYYYVVRAYQGSDESGDSNEVAYTTAAPTPDPHRDSDADGVSDGLDAFPDDPFEWIDTDGDGIGNNADLDDDGDSMPDTWELLYGLNPLVDDADLDLDGDGINNLTEYDSGSNPAYIPGNTPPDAPFLIHPADGTLGADMPPLLVVDTFSDAENDTHARTQYQISTTEDFTALVYNRTTSNHLLEMQISELILEPETTYFWRVKFIDDRNGASEWSIPFSFTTKGCEAIGDNDCDGILDREEVESFIDLDEDGTEDQLQSGLQGVRTHEAFNPRVAVKRVSTNVHVVGMRALNGNELEMEENRPERISGLISFKLNILDETTTATVVVYFSQPAPADARWYKYDPDQGWQIYPYAQFAADRKSMTLMLEDGGVGDEDGVQNGIIVDPSGLGYTSTSQDLGGSTFEPEPAAGGGCFIGAIAHGNEKRLHGDAGVLIRVLGWVALCVCVMAASCRMRAGWNQSE